MSLSSLVSSIFLIFLLIGCSTDSDDNFICKESSGEFIISTAEELIEFAELVNNGNDFLCKTVKLSTNIMLNDTTDWQSWGKFSNQPNLWIPIGTTIYVNSVPDYKLFNGTFDGNGFVVSGVYAGSMADPGGFFGWLGSNGTIKNLGVVASYGNKGGLAGNNDGTINNSYFIGIVYGNRKGNVGGLVGSNDGTINNSYSSGTVTGEEYNIGGLVGWNGGTISNSYSNSVTEGAMLLGGAIGGDKVGGLVGCNAGLINNSYSSGRVIGRSNIGGLVGYHVEIGKVINSYYDIQSSQNESAGGIGKTTAEMKERATYDGWNFDDIWGISYTMNDGYPYLLNIMVAQ